ncbi:MAG: DUF5686 family protein [Bacteroidota bacterium]
MSKPIFFLLCWSISLVVFSQKTTVSGKVTEARTGSPIPFANVVFTGTTEGGITDFDGNFSISTSLNVDSIEVRYIGYIKRTKSLVPKTEQILNFQLDEDIQTLGEVIVYAGENPAFEILRRVNDHKNENDPRSLEAYEYESYTKIEFDIDHISERLKERKIMHRIAQILDSAEQVAGDDGKPVMPIFLSEAISKFYYKKNPMYRHEEILKTQVHGIGITDGTLTSQVIGASFQQYNFYQNWLNIISKEFVSPIADGGRIYYEYDLIDSLWLDDDFCYRIDFTPKREQDLAFRGTMWITREDYALKRIDATVPRSANLNFVDRLKIQEDLVKTTAGPWLPLKTRVVVDMVEITNQSPSLIGKFYVSTKDHVANDPKENKFYQNPVTFEDWEISHDDAYWEEHRHDSLTTTELAVLDMIDTLKQVPIIKLGMDAAKFAFNGYHKMGKIEVGPYTTFLGNSDIEGWRPGFGIRTSIDFSKDWVLGGHIGYGFDDERWKYRFYLERILSRRRWSTLRVERQREIEQVWVLSDEFEPFSFLYTLSRFGNLISPFLLDNYNVKYFRQHSTGLGQELQIKHEVYTPMFDFRYFKNPGTDITTDSVFRTTEVSLKTRYAKDEIFVINDNDRLSMGTVRWPAFEFKYTYGLKDVLNSSFEYHKLKFTFQKRQKMGILGISNIWAAGGMIIGDIPYPLLYNTIGNETPFYVNFSYNLLNYYEFSSDRYAELRYRHSFEGIILNTIPLLKRLKWRLIGEANFLYGSLSDSNLNRVSYPVDSNGDLIIPFNQFTNKPYIEVGYGVENIFRVLTVQAFHRLTYLDHNNVNKFAVKFKIDFNL